MPRQLLQDLRFIIGLFFLTTGAVLVGQGVSVGPLEFSVDNLNLGAGVAMLGFAAMMLAMSIFGTKSANLA